MQARGDHHTSSTNNPGAHTLPPDHQAGPDTNPPVQHLIHQQTSSPDDNKTFLWIHWNDFRKSIKILEKKGTIIKVVSII